jgi:hypothetical protein
VTDHRMRGTPLFCHIQASPFSHASVVSGGFV